MTGEKRPGGRGLRWLLSSSSVAALLIGGGMPAALAAPCTHTVSASFDNPAAHTTANVCVNNTSFTGNITNEGTISPSGIAFVHGWISGGVTSAGVIDGGISIDTQSQIISGTHSAVRISGPTFQGGITNSGALLGANGIGVGGVTMFQGGISNSGTIAESHAGIIVLGVTSFTGGITNSSFILGVNGGIVVNNVATFQDGITNSGTISAGTLPGIDVTDVTTFQGGISNSGTISGPDGISVSLGPTFSGGITNSGAISALSAAILIGGNGTTGSRLYQYSFGGGITNTGSLSGGQGGIGVEFVTQFSGSITNSGSISGSVAGILINSDNVVGSSSAGGGITNSGNITGGTFGIIVENIGTFIGGITNSGTITAGTGTNSGTLTGGAGIVVDGIGTFIGGITNSGKITSGTNTGIAVRNVGTFMDGIVNSAGGTISGGGFDGISAYAVETFQGGITNSGTISALNAGIDVSVSTFQGGITNNGTISAGRGIEVVTTAAFSGGISNSGRISASSVSIYLTEVTTFSGGITNSGTISAGFFGIYASAATFSDGIGNSGMISGADGIAVSVSTFTGGVSNSGTISASANFGIGVSADTFSGNISNSGTITAKTGVSVVGSTITGAIIDNGTILASSHGILIDSASKISTGSSNAVAVTGPTFTGGISNAGTISSSSGSGITVAGVSTFTGGISNSGTIAAAAQFHNAIAVGTSNTAGKVLSFSGGITNSGLISEPSRGVDAGISVANVENFTGSISNSGTISAYIGLEVQNVQTFIGGITNSGTITGVGSNGTAGISLGDISTISGNVSNAGAISAKDGIVVGGSVIGADIVNTGSIRGQVGVWLTIGGLSTAPVFSGGITNVGTIAADANAIEVSAFSSFGGGITNSGTISGTLRGIFITNVATFAGNISNSGQITGATGIVINAGVGFAAGSAIVNSGTITGTGGTAVNASGATSPVTILQNAGIIGGNVLLSPNADVMTIAGGTVAGNIVGQGTSNTLNFAPGAGNTFTYGSAYDFTGVNAVNVNSGTVVVNGSANSATTLTVSNAGTLAGTGTIATAMTVKSGGTFAPGSGAPGTAMTITGSLAFQSGAFYMVQLNQTTSSLADVTGTASLNGTVKANFASGSGYTQKQYTILATTAGLGGTTFAGITTTNLPPGFVAILSYNTDDAFLNLDAALSQVSGLNGNQQNVATALSNYFNNGGALPPNFVTIFGLTGPALGTALSKLDGESATGAEHGAFQLMTEFLDLMLDPWTGGGAGSGGGGTTGFAAENDGGLPADVALAYARALKKQAPAQQQQQSFDQRWSTWASGYGGSSSSEGNAVIGSSNLTASTYGYAAGMDYRVTPDTIYGFALAGGGTNWSLAQNLGSGRSDAFQAGLHGTTHAGPLYLLGTLAFANHWFTTSRIAALGDELQAKFEGQSYAARAEAGYRYAVLPMVGFTPYAALQFQDFRTPTYSETDLSGGGFGLSYNAMNATDTRSELGARFDDLTMLGTMPLVLRGRLAWAHDWVSDPSLGAVFQALPGANFTVNGAAVPHDSALTTAAAELHLSANWTAMAKFDGEFASGSQTYAGTGTLRYTW